MTTLLALLQLLPAIIGAVQSVETAVPLPASGKTKLDLVLGTVTDVYNAEESIRKQIPNDQLIGMVTSTVGRVVTTFNALGIFKKSK